MQERGANMPATLNGGTGPSPRSVYGTFAGAATPSRENTACHVFGVSSDNLPRSFSNGTTYPNNVAQGLANTPYDIAPTGCLVGGARRGAERKLAESGGKGGRGPC
eukprot:20754-Chlamydomonas_euryale.AAC.5